MLQKTRFIQIRVSPFEYEIIQNNMKIMGHSTISSYLRNLGLDHNKIIMEKLNKILSILEEKKCNDKHITKFIKRKGISQIED